MPPKQNLASTAELAAYLGVPTATIHQWIYKGTGPRSIKIGRHRKFKWEHVEAWLEEQSQGAA
ncbi:helix-turn-helix domain-containing protein [Streptomyces sp. NPDC097941]|uniref:helix-turn-helix transcriptional regulator n=1 Tax=Streptomyces sp. NPDC097941 TaxID=3155685 RepID=UPI003324F72B